MVESLARCDQRVGVDHTLRGPSRGWLNSHLALTEPEPSLVRFCVVHRLGRRSMARRSRIIQSTARSTAYPRSEAPSRGGLATSSGCCPRRADPKGSASGNRFAPERVAGILPGCSRLVDDSNTIHRGPGSVPLEERSITPRSLTVQAAVLVDVENTTLNRACGCM